MVRPESQAIVPMIGAAVVTENYVGGTGACRDGSGAGSENARNGKTVEPRMGSEK